MKKLTVGTVVDGLTYQGGDPYDPSSWLDGNRTRGAFETANDYAIEAGNAATGFVKTVSDAISPGNRVSQALGDFIKSGEEKQSDVAKAAKLQRQFELENADGLLDEALAFGQYALKNPGLTAAEIFGNIGPVAGVVRRAGAAAFSRALGNGATKEAAAVAGQRAATGAGVALGGVSAGGDAAGSAYDLVMQIPEETLGADKDYQSLLSKGLAPEAARKELATRAARQAQVLPSLVGAASGAIGLEKMLGAPAGTAKFRGNALSRGLKAGAVEAVPEGFEEGLTTFEANRAAQDLDPSIDPLKGVGFAAAFGAVAGGVPAAGLGALSPARPSAAQERRAKLLEEAQRAIAEGRMADAAIADAEAMQTLDLVGADLTRAVDSYLAPTIDQAEADPLAVRDLASIAPLDARLQTASAMGERLAPNPVNLKIGEIQQAIEQRGGAATQEEADFLQKYGAGQPFDRIATAAELGLPSGAPKQQVPTSALIDLDTTNNLRETSRQAQPAPAFEPSPDLQGAKRQPVPELDRVNAFVNTMRRTNTPAAQAFVKQYDTGVLADADVQQALFTQGRQGNEVQSRLTASTEGRAPTRVEGVQEANELTARPASPVLEEAMRIYGNRPVTQADQQGQFTQRLQDAATRGGSAPVSAPAVEQTAQQLQQAAAQNPVATATARLEQAAQTGQRNTAGRITIARSAQRSGQTLNLGGGRSATLVSSDSLADTPTVARSADGKPVRQSMTKAQYKVMSQVARIFGKQIQLFNGVEDDGFVMPGDKKTIYLNTSSSIRPTAVMFHEMAHLMQVENREAYKALRDVVMKQATPEQQKNFAKYYDASEDFNEDELVADVFGSILEKPETLNKVLADISASYETSVARKIIINLLAALNKAVNALLATFKTGDFKTVGEFVGTTEADLQALKDAVRTAAATYAKQQRIPAVQMQGEMVQAEGKLKLDRATGSDEDSAAMGRDATETKVESEARLSPERKEPSQFQVKTAKDGTVSVKGDVEAIRASIPEDVRGRAVPGGLLFTATDAPRVKAALEGRQVAYSRAGEVVEKLPMKNGKYVGAPEKYNTPAKISSLRKSLRKLTREGEPGRYWYENSSKAVLDRVGGNVQEARKFVALLAIYSPQAKVDSNSTFALRAWAQYKSGQPINVKTGVVDSKATDAMQNIDAFWSGEKTGNFFFNLLREIDPSTKGKQGATIDMWMMRAGEYSTDAPSATQYSFMENETNRIAQEFGWEPQQVQAAIWVAMKARMENAGVKKRTEEISEKNGWIRFDYPLKNGNAVKTRVILNAQKHRDNWVKQALEYDPNSEDTKQAKFDFSDGVRRHIGQISWEARPGRTTGVLPGIHNAAYEQQVEFQQAVQKALLDDDGIDLLAYKLGLLVDGPDILAPGVWQGDVAAGMQKRVAIAPAKGSDGKTTIDPAQKKALDTYAAVLGLLLKQEGVGYHRPFYKGNKSAENAVEINIGRPLSDVEAKSLWGALDQQMRDAGFENWEDAAGMISSPNGMRVVNFGAVPDNLKFRELAKTAASTLAVDEVDFVSFSTDGNLVMNDWKENPDGEGYRQRISEAYGPDLLRWAGSVLAPRVQSVFQQFSSKYGWGDPGKAYDAADIEVGEETPRVKASKRRAAQEIKQYAAEFGDTFFRTPRIDSSSMKDIAQALRLKVSEVANPKAFDGKNKPDQVFTFEMDKGKKAYVSRKNNAVWINVADLETGDEGGNIYMAAGAFAFNNGYKLIGDPDGITQAGMRRRLENMIALALKYGSTDFIEPHSDMTGLPGQKAGLGNFRWLGSSDDKLALMLDASYNVSSKLVPEVKDVVFEEATGKFRSLDGERVVQNSDFEDMATRARAAASPAERSGMPGSGTLRLGVIYRSLASSQPASELSESVDNSVESGEGRTGALRVSTDGIRRSTARSSDEQGVTQEQLDDATADNPNSQFWKTVDALRRGVLPGIRRGDYVRLFGRYRDAGAELVGNYNPSRPTGLEALQFSEPLFGSTGFYSVGKKGTNSEGSDVYVFSFVPEEFADAPWQAQPNAYAALTVTATQDQFNKNRYIIGVGAADPSTEAGKLLQERGLLEATGQFSSNGTEYYRTPVGSKATLGVLSEAARRLAIAIRRTPDEITYSRETGANPSAVRTILDADTIQARFSRSRQTETPEFKAWFGNSQAAVLVNPSTGLPVESSKEPAVSVPQVMYHTTKNNFTEFEIGRLTKNSGTFGDWETQRYAVFVTPELQASEAYGKSAGGFLAGANVMPLYVKAEKPLDFTSGMVTSDVERQFEEAGFNPRWLYRFDWSRFDDEEGKDFVETAKSLGYDSVIFNDENPDTGESFEAWAVFEPTQLKSAIGNNGQFDPTNPDIRFSKDRAAYLNAVAVALDTDASAGKPLPVMRENPLLDVLGMRKAPVVTNVNNIRKKMFGDHQMTRQEIEDLFEGIYSPAMVFDSDTQKDGSVVLVTGKMKGSMPIVAVIKPESAFNNMEVRLLKTAFGKDGYGVMNRWYEEGLLRYFDKEKALDPTFTVRVQFPWVAQLARKLPSSVLGPADVFNSSEIKRSTNRSISPAMSKLDDVIYKLQDKNIDLRRVTEAIRKNSSELDDEVNAYQREELYHGRAAKQSQDFLNRELRPLLDEMKARKVSLQDFETYLWNRHAEERNVAIAKVNDRFPDGGSGIQTADARAYLANLDPDKRRAFEALAARVDAMTSRNLQMMVDSGLETQETVDAMRGAYKAYVPLLRGESSSYTGRGQGYSIKGATTKRALGSDKPVENILSALADQREKIISRAEKARVGRAVMGLALQNPQEDFWFVFDPLLNRDATQRTELRDQLEGLGLDPDLAEEISAQPYEEYIGPNGRVSKRPNRKLMQVPNALAVRIAGEDKFVVFNQENPRAKRMAEALTNMDAPQLEGALGVLGKISRYFASINTQYNPVFGIVNLIRDTQGAMLNLTSTKLAGKQKEVLAGVASAVAAIYRVSRAERNGGTVTGPWADVYERFLRQGGQTGYRDMFDNPKDRTQRQLRKELTPNALEQAWSKSTGPVFDWLSDYNETLENSVRLSAFKTALDSGMSDEQAASLAKNLTVNFNRKGQIGVQAGALYAFYNASTQGTARLLQTMAGPMGKKIAAGGVLLGVAQTLMLAAAGYDDDQPPEFVRERNLVIPTGGGQYLTLPMPLGPHVLPNIGRVVAEQLMGRTRQSTVESLASVFGTLVDAFNPVGSSTLLQTLSPTVLDPAVALAENKDFSGKNIARADMNENRPTPGYTRTKENSLEVLTSISKALNYLSGGSDYTKGVVSPTPDQLEYVIGQVTGGVGRELSKLWQVAETTATGEELPSYKVPLLGRLYGSARDQASEGNQFYANLRAMNDYKLEITGRAKNGEDYQSFLAENPEARLFKAAENVEQRVQELRRLKRNLKERDADPAAVAKVEDAITRVMRNFNQQVALARGREVEVE